MIHEPWSIVVGSSKDMRDEADLLEKIEGTISKTYQDKSGKSPQEIADLMAAETWFTDQEALDNGFIDVIEDLEDDRKAKARTVLFDLSAFANVPDGLMAVRKPPTERELERILRDAGFSNQQAKAILSEGFPKDSRDVESAGPPPAEVPGDQRDVDPGAPRDVAQPVAAKKDRIADLLIRAELASPTKNNN
jgi:hypothetical protein